ncbi:leucine-rich repeat domain-containing protein, partial [Candidatus Poribacteria bacterium]|nr:leucine-rich repeat domain-containing protein [Candidatus Poribacteria bacterium]
MKKVKRLLALIFVFVLYISAEANTLETDWMPDPALRAAVREVIELPPAAVLTKDYMLWFDYLHAWHTNITDLTGLEHATHLRDLNICDNGGVSDLTPLANLTNLVYLGLCGSQISDVSPLANLTNLKGLDLGGNNISDITPLENLVNLEWINLGG